MDGHILVVQLSSPWKKQLSVFTERGHYITNISKHVLRPLSLSVRKDGNLLVCDGCDVKVLSPDGTKLKHTIKAPYCYESPWFAVYHQGMFFVSYDSLHYGKHSVMRGSSFMRLVAKDLATGS